MGRLRVAHVIYSPALGGSEMIAVELCSRLDRSRFDPLLLFMYPGEGPVPALLEKRGVPFAALRCTRLRRLAFPWLAARTLSRLQVDVLHVHHVPLWSRLHAAARRAHVPIVLTEHAKFSISRSPALQDDVRAAAADVALFTVVSEDLKRWLEDALQVPPARVEVVPNGADTERFRPGGGDPALVADLVGPGRSAPVLVTVGRLAEAKDHANVFAALALLRSEGLVPTLLVVGDGALRPGLERRAAELGLGGQVVFAGTRTDVERIVPACAAFVLGSQREGFPMAVLEALASGVPVVSTDVGGIGEVIESGRNGLLVPPKDPRALADALRRVLTEPAAARAMADAGRRTVLETYALSRTVARFEAAYERIARGVRGAAAPAETVR